jgi:hypothetical protein
MKQRGGNPSMVPRRGFATEPTWRVQDHSFEHLSRDFCATKLWPKFRVDPPNSRDREPGSTRGNHFAHSFSLRFSLPSSCLNSAFRIDISGCLQSKRRQGTKASTTANACTDPTSQPKTSEKTPTLATTRQSPRLDLLSRF